MTDFPADSPVDDLAEEFARRWRQGERPSIEEYAARFPQWADEIREALQGVLLMEELRPKSADLPVPTYPPTFAPPMPQRIGPYHILCEIGRGGMGVVYEARQDALGRHVAIKVLPPHLMDNPRLRERFRRESQAAARLHHTNIVPVFDVGEQDGLCYYVMQLIHGRGLDTLLSHAHAGEDLSSSRVGVVVPSSQTLIAHLPPAGPVAVSPEPGTELALTPRAVAHIGAKVAAALAYAHTHGVVHRDIKPSNLLLDTMGGVWVTDFGVAKLALEASLTQSGDWVGTLRYMAPERFSGQCDARSDVYSLGITLYEVLTCRPAFPNAVPQVLIQLITEGRLVPLRKLAPAVPTDLETIILKAVARDPAHRYQTAADLGSDLRRFLEDRPVLARRLGRGELLWRWCRRNPALATMTTTAILLLVAITVISIVAWVHTAAANRAAAAANRDMEKALAAETAQREHAASTARLALDALNRTYERFAPARLVVTPVAAKEAGTDLPPQPALPAGAEPLLEDLLHTYEQIAHSGSELPHLHIQAAEAHHRIGDICQRLGRFEAAVAAYRTAIALYTPPEDEGARIKLARAYNDRGRVLRLLQQSEAARQMHQQAIEVLGDASPELASRPECRYELAHSYYLLGLREQVFSPRGFGTRRPPPPGQAPATRPTQPNGDAPGQRAVVLLAQLVQDFPNVPEYRHLLACCYRDVPLSPPIQAPATGTDYMDRAVELMRQLVKDCPDVPDYRFELCETLVLSGRPGRRTDSEGPARRTATLEEAVARSRELIGQYANVPEYVAAHARYLDLLGNVYARAGKFEEGAKLQRKAVAILQRVVQHYPDVVFYGYSLSWMERSLSRALRELGQPTEARMQLESAAARLEALRQKSPHLEALRMVLSLVYRDLTQLYQDAGEKALAAEVTRKSRAIEEQAEAATLGR
jgi:serine/threonine protein kinase